jgi:vancomycin resistance protein YoaR
MKRPLLLSLSGVAALGLGWGAFEVYHAGRILPGVQAAGVNVGGLTVDEAAARLQGANLRVPVVRVSAGAQTTNVNATELGWRADYTGTAQSAFQIGRSSGLVDNVARRFTGGKRVPLQAKVDPKTFANRLEALAQPFEIAPKPAAIVFADGQYVVRADQTGRGLNFDKAARAFAADPSLSTLTLETTAVAASPTKTDLEPLATQANAVLRPLALQYTPLEGDAVRTRTLSKAEVAGLYFVRREGLSVDKAAVAAILKRIANAYDQEARSARYVRAGGGLERRPANPGYALDMREAQRLLEGEVLRPEARTVALPVKVTQPKIVDAALPQTKDLKVIATGFTRYYGSSAARIANVAIAAGKLDGYVVPAGEEFSFNDAVGEISAETGFVEGLVISQGRTTKGVGGGVCQASTTTFNALYKAGLPVVERNQHSYKVHYYDDVMGRDAAVYYGALDLRMKNDTPGPLLVRASTKGATMTVQVYGVSDGRKVALSPPRILSRTPAPPPVTEFSSALPAGARVQVDWAADGYVVTAARTITNASGTKQTDVMTTRYRPWRAVYQVGPARVRPAAPKPADVGTRPTPSGATVVRTSAPAIPTRLPSSR